MAGVNEILDTIERLPALPAAVLRAVAMLGRNDFNIDELTKIILHDEALCAAVLKCANSSMYGIPGRQFNLNQSIIRLGRGTLLGILLQQKTSTVFAESGEAYGLRRGALWRGALGGAFAAKQLAEDHGFDEPDLCFLCGLLRDIGKLALEQRYGDECVDLTAEHETPDRTYDECERIAFGADHARIGGALAQRWGLPERICDAISLHHDPPPPGNECHDDLFDLVHAGDIIALWAGFAIGHDGMRYRLAQHVRESLGLEHKEAESDIAAAWVQVQEIENMMNDIENQEQCA